MFLPEFILSKQKKLKAPARVFLPFCFDVKLRFLGLFVLDLFSFKFTDTSHMVT